MADNGRAKFVSRYLKKYIYKCSFSSLCLEYQNVILINPNQSNVKEGKVNRRGTTAALQKIHKNVAVEMV